MQLLKRGDEGRRKKPEEKPRGASGPVAVDQLAQRTAVRTQSADQPVEKRVPGAGRRVGHGGGVPRRRVERSRAHSVVGRRVRRGGLGDRRRPVRNGTAGHRRTRRHPADAVHDDVRSSGDHDAVRYRAHRGGRRRRRQRRGRLVKRRRQQRRVRC